MKRVNIIIPIMHVIKLNVSDPINKLISDAMIIPNKPINRIVPSFVKSFFVVIPITDIIRNISDVNPNTYIIESILYARNIIDNVSPVNIEYNTYNVFAVIIFIFLIPADSHITTTISMIASNIYVFV